MKAAVQIDPKLSIDGSPIAAAAAVVAATGTSPGPVGRDLPPAAPSGPNSDAADGDGDGTDAAVEETNDGAGAVVAGGPESDTSRSTSTGSPSIAAAAIDDVQDDDGAPGSSEQLWTFVGIEGHRYAKMMKKHKKKIPQVQVVWKCGTKYVQCRVHLILLLSLYIFSSLSFSSQMYIHDVCHLLILCLTKDVGTSPECQRGRPPLLLSICRQGGSSGTVWMREPI
jgi:hypothetical protein